MKQSTIEIKNFLIPLKYLNDICQRKTLVKISMPLIKGKKAKTKEGISENIRREIHAGKKKNQAVAIAMSMAKKIKK